MTTPGDRITALTAESERWYDVADELDEAGAYIAAVAADDQADARLRHARKIARENGIIVAEAP